ncbi:hypothetical protein JKP88DRAFT_284721 [Tribonema minus]|uniref:Uncharacterized protein n=1 Tax=Tribonema minus TaxID=303371 RepID=A0A836CMI7_9STRA|nr:hypothetical protein JKP88DRAFT_284721 [Tribonema minus]
MLQPRAAASGDQGNGDQPLLESGLIESGGRPVSIDLLCNKEVFGKFDAVDKKAHVGSVHRGELNCASLGLSESMPSLNFSFQGGQYFAVKTLSDFFGDAGGRHVWVGELTEQVGFVSVVWDDACDPRVFQLDVTLASDNDGHRHTITSIPCSEATSVPSCVWMAAVATEMRDEFDVFDRRHLESVMASHTQDHQDLDDDVELLQQLMDGNGDAHDHFVKNGGRRLEEAGQVVMPSGRRLDDGSTVRVLWLYSNRVRDRWTDDTITSKIAAGVATANQALANSGVSFRVKAAAIMHVDYDDTTHMEALAALNTGSIAGINTARDKYSADLVQMVIESSEYCGYGNLLYSASSSFAPYGFSVVYSDCIVSYSHIHEIGHNMGCQHNAENSGDATMWSYGVGYRYCNDGVSKSPYYRSVMSYACTGATRVPYFSSPDVEYQGRTTGLDTADNVRVLEQTHYTVANFRQGNGVPVATSAPTPTRLSRQGKDYFDTDPTENKASTTFRKDQGVDCSPSMVSYTMPNEWIQYTRTWPGGYYDIAVTGSSASGSKIGITFRNKSGDMVAGTGRTTISFPKTGSFSTFKSITGASTVYLPKGVFTMRVFFFTGGLNVKNIMFNRSAGTTGDPVDTPADVTTGAGGQSIPSKGFQVKGAVAVPGAEVSGLKLADNGLVSWISDGDSAVLTLNVAYALAGDAPPNTELRVSLLQGRTVCHADDGNVPIGGALKLSNFSTGSFTDFWKHGATNIFLEAGPGQLFTLCFAKASNVILDTICIAPVCPAFDFRRA